MPASSLPTIERGGRYYRVCKPHWGDCSDMSYAKQCGGRFTPKGEFGALYLNKTLRVAAAQARSQHAGRAIGLFDLRAERRPQLATFEIPTARVLDVVGNDAIRALRLPASYPIGVDREQGHPIARRAYHRRLAGVAARSAAEARVDEVVGEELAYFDSQPPLRELRRQTFAQWYPDPHPP